MSTQRTTLHQPHHHYHPHPCLFATLTTTNTISTVSIIITITIISNYYYYSCCCCCCCCWQPQPAKLSSLRLCRCPLFPLLLLFLTRSWHRRIRSCRLQSLTECVCVPRSTTIIIIPGGGGGRGPPAPSSVQQDRIGQSSSSAVQCSLPPIHPSPSVLFFTWQCVLANRQRDCRRPVLSLLSCLSLAASTAVTHTEPTRLSRQAGTQRQQCCADHQ